MVVARHASIFDFRLTELPAGFKGPVVLDAFDLLRGRVRIPLVAVVGRRPGPTLLAVAGVHGNEYEGQAAVREVYGTLDPAQLCGTYAAIPVCNVFAYEARARCTPPHLDGQNLARVFPGDAHGSATPRLAHALMQLVTRNLGPDDLFIDFHSGSEDCNYLPLVGVRDIASAGRAASEAAARHFGGSQLWLIDDKMGMFNAEVSRVGIPTIGTETTGQAGCRPEDVTTFVEGLRNLLRFRRMLPGATPPRADVPFRRGVPVVSATSGFLRFARRLGDHVAPGDVLGEIVTVFGERLPEYRAPAAGQIWMQRTTPAIQSGETICILGLPDAP